MTEYRPATRRDTLKALAAGAAMLTAARVTAATADAPATAALEAAFRAAFATPADTPAAMPAARLAFLADDALVIDHDVPFPLDRAGWADHLAFHAANWQRVETRLHDLSAAVHGATGSVSAYFIERGKPRNAGFRLRAGYCTAVCVRDNGRWRAIGLHLAPLSGQITDASPG